MKTSMDNTADPLFDPSTKKLDKWRFMFHVFNMTTFTVAVISLGVSLTTYTAAPPYPSNVKEYAIPVIYYGINGAVMTAHASFGALSCVKGNLLFLKIYTLIGYALVIEEIGMGSWLVATLQDRIAAAIAEIKKLEDGHHEAEGEEHDEEEEDHEEEEEEEAGNQTRRSVRRRAVGQTSQFNIELLNRSKREIQPQTSEEYIHSLYSDINSYYQCCMYANEWIEEENDLRNIYTHCLTEGDYFCGMKFILFPGKNVVQSVQENCACDKKVKAVMTDRIVRQTVLLFIALPSQILCLVCVAFFIKFEITVRDNEAADNVSFE